MDDAGKVTENGETDVDEQVNRAADLEEDSQRRQEDGANKFADIAASERHGGQLNLDAIKREELTSVEGEQLRWTRRGERGK